MSIDGICVLLIEDNPIDVGLVKGVLRNEPEINLHNVGWIVVFTAFPPLPFLPSERLVRSTLWLTYFAGYS